MSKVKCHKFGQMGHSTSKCTKNNKGKEWKYSIAPIVEEVFVSKFKKELSVFSIESSIGTSSLSMSELLIVGQPDTWLESMTPFI